MNESLHVLADLIHDVGYWRWWAANPPHFVQIAFGGVQLAVTTPEGPRPVSELALRFREPSAAVFLTREGAELSAEWPTLLHEDKHEPFGVSHEQFTFDDSAFVAALLATPADAYAIHGDRPTRAAWEAAPARVAFWAGPVGVVILAARLEVVTHAGVVELTALSEMRDRWWAYWREYWRRRGTAAALPEDWACEVTIPFAG